MKIKLKIDFYTSKKSKKSISRNGCVMKGKNGIANEFHFFFDPNSRNVPERNSRSM
jgi:hypothetical protein